MKPKTLPHLLYHLSTLTLVFYAIAMIVEPR